MRGFGARTAVRRAFVDVPAFAERAPWLTRDLLTLGIATHLAVAALLEHATRPAIGGALLDAQAVGAAATRARLADRSGTPALVGARFARSAVSICQALDALVRDAIAHAA
jgi:hypothetical protein